MVNGFVGAIGQGAVIAITIRAIDQFSSTFRKATKGTNLLTAGLTAGITAVTGFGVAMTALGVSAVKIAGDFEQTTVAFTTMLGSGEEAKKFLEELADFAKKTPFTLPGVERSARQLLAVGFEAKDVLPVLKNVGNVAAGLGLGEAGLQRLILNLGQVQSQGKLTGRELRDFAVAGIPLLDELSRELGKTTEEVSDLISKGEIQTDVVLRAFKNMATSGGRFADLMEKQAKTVQGRFSNLKDTLILLGRELGETLLPAVGRLASVLLDDLLPSVKPLILQLGTFMQGALKGLVDVLPFLVSGFSKMFSIMIDLFEAISPLMQPLGELAFNIFDAMAEVLGVVIPFVSELAPIFSETFEAISPIITPLKEFVVESVKLAATLSEGLLDNLDQLGVLLEPIAFALGQILDFITPLIRKFNELNKAMENFRGIRGDISIFGGAIGFGGPAVLGGGRRVGDAIIKPDGSVIETDPQDTLFAVKDPKTRGDITFIVQGNLIGLDEADISRRLADELNTKTSL